MRDAAPDETAHVVLIEPDRRAATLVDELLRLSWRGPLSVTHAERLDDLGTGAGGIISGSVAAVLLGGDEQLAALERMRTIAPAVPVLVLGSDYAEGSARVSLRAGAQDVLAKFDLTPVALRRALQHAIERKRSEGQLASRALQDPLTGLPNRTLFVDRLGIALERTRRTGAVTGVLFLDVDHFKLINDSLGHDAGDRVLSALADRLRSVLRPMDTVARFGGDEFTFLFEDLSNPDEALAIAERVRQVATMPVGIGEEQHELTVSIGVATTSDAGIAADAIIREADAAMYEAKGRGGGEAAFVRHDPPDLGALERSSPRAPGRAIEPEELRRAIDTAELRVVYQPHYLLEERRLSGFEALVRWQHPELGLLAPAEFLPVADEHGMTVAIGEFVLREALALLARVRRSGAELWASVNVALSQLGDPQLATALAVVDAAGVHPAAVYLEIRESAVTQEPDTVIRAARLLKAAGVRLAIDDYGTGSAPLHSLRTLQADLLKIHPRFVSELGGTGTDGAMVAAVVELGHALGMTVTAEGVETDAQLAELRELGCDAAQGFALARPVAADQLEALIAAAA